MEIIKIKNDKMKYIKILLVNLLLVFLLYSNGSMRGVGNQVLQT